LYRFDGGNRKMSPKPQETQYGESMDGNGKGEVSLTAFRKNNEQNIEQAEESFFLPPSTTKNLSFAPQGGPMPFHSSGFQAMNPYSGQGNMLPPSVAPVTHNLIPPHLQAAVMAAQQQQIHNFLHGTPGHQPALINPFANPNASALNMALAPPTPALTVQDRPMVPPVFNGINPNYPGLRMLNANPPVLAVDNFLTHFECDFLIGAAVDAMGPAPVVGKGAGEISPSRTSSTCYLAREDLPDLLRKVHLLTGKPIEHCELPQVGRYLPSQQYLQHFDAFDLSNEDGLRFAANGGQRTVTVLMYLNDVQSGGQTAFPALNLEVQPRKGMAVVFFPATVDGLLDKMALHAALPAVDPKFVSQVWIRQGEYKGQPSKRLSQTLGVPFDHVQTASSNAMMQC